jgi:hypothetical protein
MPRTWLLLKDRVIRPADLLPGDIELSLEMETLSELIDSLAIPIENNPIAKLQNSDIIYWLTYLLDCAVKKSATEQVSVLCKLMQTIAKKKSGPVVGNAQ